MLQATKKEKEKIQILQEAWFGLTRILGRNKPSFPWEAKPGCHVPDLPPAMSLMSREAFKNEGDFEREAGRKAQNPTSRNSPDFSFL